MTTLSKETAVVAGYQLVRGTAAANATYNTLINVYNGGGETALATAITQATAGQTNAQLAATVVANAGFSNRADLVSYVADLFGIFGASARGQVILNLAERLSSFTSDANYGAVAAGFNTTIAANAAYSANVANTADGRPANGSGGFLTNGVDNLVGVNFTAPQVYNPGGTDFINSLQNDDVLTGTGTNNTLTVTLGNPNDNGASLITPTLNNINVINARFDATSSITLDLQDSTGVREINVTRISSGTTATIQNIGQATSKLSITNSNASNNNVVFSYLGSALSGAADATTLTLSNVNTQSITIQENATTPTEGFETINLVSSGSANKVGQLIAEDLKTLTITGDKNLTLGTTNPTTGTQGVEATRYSAGLANVAGSLTKIDASAFTGALDLTIGNEISAGADNTSGVQVQLSVTGGSGNDVFRITEAATIGGVTGNTDKIDGGAGTNTLVLLGGVTITAAATSPVANLTNIQALEVRTGHDNLGAADTATINADAFDKLATIYVRNEGQTGTVPGAGTSTAEVSNVILNNLTATQAAGLTVAHGTTGNNAQGQTNVTATLKTATGATDLVGVTLVDGVNSDPRFNLNLTAGGTTAATRVESITLTDTDTESNTVNLVNAAQHIGTITITGGAAGQFFNLDTGTTAAGGLLRKDVAGTATDGVGIVDVGTGAQNRLTASVIDASAALSDVILRVSTSGTYDANGAFVPSATGGQKITTGAGNDVVIFDLINDARAGLTISDTVDGGAGNDTLVIDGHSVRVSIGASEWTNVSNFETIRLVGNGAVPVSTRIGENSYNLTLTNELIAKNGVNGLIAIVNDNDPANDTAGAAVTAGVGVVSGVTIDGRSLSSTSHFSYNGEEGAAATADRFVLSDANINGANIIDGGAADNLTTTFAANTDVLEVRNAAVVSVGDLANIKNVGTLAFTNDGAVNVAATLELNDTVLDALVDSYHTATTAERETLTVRTNDIVADLPGAVANTALDLDVSQVSGKFNVNVNLGQIGGTVAVDNVKLGTGGATTAVTNFNTLDAGDNIVVSASQFGLSAAAVGTIIKASGSGVVFGALGTGAATDRLYIVEGAGIAGYGAAANDIGIYYDADGSGSGAAVLIGVLVDTGAGSLAGVANAGITVVA